jgi:hypothetical protein
MASVLYGAVLWIFSRWGVWGCGCYAGEERVVLFGEGLVACDVDCHFELDVPQLLL